jgi:hypothetical protein
MLYRPLGWYAKVLGVSASGAANFHFIRDIGCANLAAALGLGIFLTLHALVHVWDMLAGRELLQNLRAEALAIFLPGLLTLWLALSSAPTDGRRFKS